MQFLYKLSKLTISLRLLVVLVFSLTLWSKSQAQNSHPHLKYFNVQTLNGKLLVSWTTRAGFSCQDVHIELSTDSINWDRKATLFGVCGDTVERDYSMVVDSPYTNAINYVRLVLGEFGFSEVLQLRVIDRQSVFQIVPHPANSGGKIYVRNANRDRLTLQFHSLQGELVYEMESVNEVLTFPDFKQSGLFVYMLYTEDMVPTQTGKILFQQE